MDNNKDNKNEYHIFKGYIIPTKTHIENLYSVILCENSI